MSLTAILLIFRQRYHAGKTKQNKKKRPHYFLNTPCTSFSCEKEGKKKDKKKKKGKRQKKEIHNEFHPGCTCAMQIRILIALLNSSAVSTAQS